MHLKHPLGSRTCRKAWSMRSTAGKPIRRQRCKINALLIETTHNNKSNWSRTSRSQSLLIERITTTNRTSYCSNRTQFWLVAKTDRQKDFCTIKPFLGSKKVDFHGLVADLQTFEADRPPMRNPCLRRPLGNRFFQNSACIFDTGHPVGFRAQ